MENIPDLHINILEAQTTSLNHSEQQINNENHSNEGSFPEQNQREESEEANQQQAYIPPNEYNPHNINNTESEVLYDPTSYLKAKIMSIEKRLHRGWYLSFRIWLYLFMAFTLCALARQGLVYTFAIIQFGLYSWNLLPLIFVVLGSSWNLRQCWLMASAISTFDLEKANKSFELIKGFLVFYSVLLVFVFIFEMPSFAIILHIYNYYSSLVLFLGANLIVIGITFHGITKIREKLRKRNNLKLELEEVENRA